MSKIDVKAALDMIERYKQARPNLLSSGKSEDILTLSETFPRQDFDDLLKQPDCENIRIFFGMDEDMNIRAIAVAVNGKNQDILVSGNEVIVENGHRCPEDCPEPSEINP